MKKTHYKLPLDIGRLFTDAGGHLELCSEVESVDQSLALLFSTHQGEHSFDHNYGTKLWEMDFVNVISKELWEDEFVGYILQAIADNEKRIKDVRIGVNVNDVLHEEASMAGFSVRKRVDIITQAVMVSTDKKVAFKHTLYVGPLSGD
jgi:phage baseplate assembly protein W